MRNPIFYIKILVFYFIFAPVSSANEIRELCSDTDHLEPIGKQLCSCERKYADGSTGKECMANVINKNKSILAPSGLPEELAAVNMMCAMSYHYIMQRQMRGKCEPSPAVQRKADKERAEKEAAEEKEARYFSINSLFFHRFTPYIYGKKLDIHVR